jgi:putative nucleotidyltransferase with HDIG domain
MRVLCLEDSPLDAELTMEALAVGMPDANVVIAEDGESYARLLRDDGGYDVILADYAVPGFDAHRALALAREECPGTAFICVSGTIGEEATVELLKGGADDCVLKDRMARLPFAVRRAIDERAARRRLAETERRATLLVEHLLNGYAHVRHVRDETGRLVDWVYLDVNPAFGRITGASDVVTRRGSEVLRHFDGFARALLPIHEEVARTGCPQTAEVELRPLGKWLHVSVYGAEPGTDITVFEDVTARREALETLRSHAEQLKRTVEGAVEAMGAMIAARDPYTSGHERRVTRLAVAIAHEMGLPAVDADAVRLAALVHDIGKISVPAEILSKPSRLTATQFELIKTHPGAAYEMLATVAFEQPIAEIVFQHHERLDGSGYPRGLKRGEIRREAMILAVADVVEAMASHRPYRPALGVEAALAEVERGAGRMYDPEAVEACRRLFDSGFTLESDDALTGG